MGSFYGSTSEIVEVLEEVGCVQNGKKTNQKGVHNKEQKPQLMKLGYDSTLENDINKLFESISLKVSSKNQNSPDQITTGISKKNALKKPMRAGGNSPGIGFSEPVSLKQALRRQCISQASEMAAFKRLTNPIGSPRISEAGMITSMYRSVVVESGESSGSANRFSRDEEEISSPGFSLEKNGKGIKSMLNNIKPVDESIVTEQTTKAQTQTTKGKFEKSDPSGEIVSEKENESVVPQLEQKKSLPRSRRKGRLQIAANPSNTIRGSKSLRKVSPSTFKSVPRNRSIVKKNLKLASVPTEDFNIKIHSPTENNISQLLCQRCHCTMTHESTESSTGDIVFSSNAASSYGKGRNIVEMEKKSRIVEKVDFSQSSNSSLGDYSTSTSNSEESNASGSICGNRPHMAKDSKWEAIQQANKHSGGLGLTHFSLLKKLGSGDIGTVYLAELVGTNCMFAIKVMDNEFLARRKKITRAQTERDILRMLDHPFLPTLYGQFTSDNLSCLIMEYCPGGDLHVLRQRQPGRFFPEQAARFYVAEVLLALEYLHMLGVIYRDLKPENIMVREDGHIMLTDFDLSLRCDVNPTLLKSSSLINEPPKISGPCTGSNCIDPFCAEPTCQVSCFSPHFLPPSTKQRKKTKPDLPTRFRSLPQLVAEPTEARSNSFVGTHEYLAPEIIKGEGHGSAVDWWTFGVFLYELLYGKTPFKGSGNEETLANVVLLGLRFPDSPLVSFQARDLIRGLLVKEPENRLGSQRGAAEIKQHAFFDGLNWALIRCAVPPQVPEFFEVDQEMEIKYLDCGDDGGDQLEFELF